MTEQMVYVKPLPFTDMQQRWLEQAWPEITSERLKKLLVEMVNISSPTGEERRLAEYAASYMKEVGLEARYQPIDEQQGNAIGRLKGNGTGPELLLYAPLDTDFSGIEEEDCPGVGKELPSELRPQARVEDGYVTGLGAVNPKGFATCVISAAEAIRRANIPLQGDLIVGLGAGGMPTNKRRSGTIHRYNIGQGTGCAFMLEQGVRGDFAIIAKPGWSVAWEEVGLCWFKIQVQGKLGYVGTRHMAGYKNSIVLAATLIHELEDWFPRYTARNTSGLVAPQGVVGAIEGGWNYKPAFIPATCTLYVDLRVSPRTDPMCVKRQFGEAVAEIQARHPGMEIDWEMTLAIPGGHTEPSSWIVQSCVRAWEFVEKRPHTPTFNTSGATDANILRGWGIATARMGLPRTVGGRVSARAATVSNMQRLVQCLVYSIIDTCSRTRSEVGL